jgi:hypothetical protein
MCFVLFCFFFAGEQEVRVLTLAEQIIAAMPERIKVCGLSFLFSVHSKCLGSNLIHMYNVNVHMVG